MASRVADPPASAMSARLPFATSPDEFCTWVDHLADVLGPFKDVLFGVPAAVFFGAVPFIVGLVIAAAVGLRDVYLTSPGVYVSCIGIAYSVWIMRWASRSIHGRDAALRVCFDVTDEEYRKVVASYLRKATNNRKVVLPAGLFMLFVWAYFAFVFFGPPALANALLIGFPSAGFSSVWHSGGSLIAKMAILDLFSGCAIFCVYTAARFTFWAARVYPRLLDLPVRPLPHLVLTQFQGVVGISLVGTFAWSGGVILGELLYGTRVDALGGAFLIWVIIFGLVAYLLPHNAVRAVLREAKTRAIDRAMDVYLHANSERLTIAQLAEVDNFIHSTASETSGRLTIYQALSLAVGQLLPLVPVIYSTFFNGALAIHLR